MAVTRKKTGPLIARTEIALDSALDHVLILDPEGNMLYANALGKKSFPLSERTIQSQLPLESVDAVNKALWKALMGEEAVVTFSHQTPQGKSLTLEGFFTGTYWGSKQAILGILRELDIRQQELKTLAEQHALSEGLRETAGILNSTLNLDELMDKILEIVGRVVPHDASSLMVLEHGIARVVRHRGYRERGLEKAVNEVRFTVASTPNFKAMVETNQPQVIGDIKDYPGWVAHDELNWVRSYASAPVIVRGEVIGFLNLDSETPHFYNLKHAERLRLFADQVALAIQNARLYSEIQRNAITDELTGLLNRRGLFDSGKIEVQRAKRYKSKLAMILFDIDHFKMVNDSFGHHIGDVVLAEVGKRCRHALRQVDCIGRYGGEEFAIMLPECTLDFAHEVAERIQKAITSTPYETEAGKIPLTISIGVTHLVPGDTDFSALVRRADAAMYAAKQAGRDRISFIPPKEKRT